MSIIVESKETKTQTIHVIKDDETSNESKCNTSQSFSSSHSNSDPINTRDYEIPFTFYYQDNTSSSTSTSSSVEDSEQTPHVKSAKKGKVQYGKVMQKTLVFRILKIEETPDADPYIETLQEILTCCALDPCFCSRYYKKVTFGVRLCEIEKLVDNYVRSRKHYCISNKILDVLAKEFKITNKDSVFPQERDIPLEINITNRKRKIIEERSRVIPIFMMPYILAYLPEGMQHLNPVSRTVELINSMSKKIERYYQKIEKDETLFEHFYYQLESNNRRISDVNQFRLIDHSRSIEAYADTVNLLCEEMKTLRDAVDQSNNETESLRDEVKSSRNETEALREEVKYMMNMFKSFNKLERLGNKEKTKKNGDCDKPKKSSVHTTTTTIIKKEVTEEMIDSQ